MKKILVSGGVSLIVLALVLAGCNTAVETGPGNVNGEVTDITITIPGGYKNPDVFTGTNYPGYELTLADQTFTGKLADISNYSSVAVTTKIYDPAGTEITTQANSLGQFAILLDGSSGWGTENQLVSEYNLKVSGGATSASVAAGKTGQPGKLLIQTADGSKVGYIAVLSITFKAKKAASDADFSGSESFAFGDDTTHETLATYQGKSDVVKIVPASGWAPLRVDLGDYAGRTVTVTVSIKVWMDQASKIMFQTNDSSYTVISGGNDSYDANKWVEFTGNKEVTLPAKTETGNPWFYLDNGGLTSGASYYFADFTLDVE